MAKDNWLNRVHIEGRVFSHTLQKRVSGEASKNPGQEYIGGTLNVATDEDGINVVPVRFTYVTPTYRKSGKVNETYNILSQIIDEDKTWSKCGKDDAQLVRIDGDIEVNDFLGNNGEMVEAKGVRGSFVHFVNTPAGLCEDESERNSFEADMLITGTIDREVEDGDDYLDLRGYVFGYQSALIPVTLSIRTKDGINYFEKCDISNENPLLIKVWGNIICSTKEVKTEIESAFGGSQVKTSTRTTRSWDIAGAGPEPYDWDDESTITIKEFKALLDERAQVVAAAKKRSEEYQNRSKNSNSAFGGETKKAETSDSSDNSMAGYVF